MRRYLWGFVIQLVALAACATAHAQSVFPGKLPVGCTDAQLPVWQASTNLWICGSGAGTGDVTASGTLTNNALLLGGGTKVAKATTTGTGVVTALGVNVGSAGAFVTFNGALGTPSSGTLTSATGLPISTGLTGAGTGVLTALGVNVGSAGAPVLFNGAGGTPSSMTGTNFSGIPLAALVAGSDNGIPVSSGVAYVQKILPDCTDTGGNHLNYTDSTNSFSCGTSGSGGAAPIIRAAYAAKTGNYTVNLSTDGTIELTTNVGTITLPTAVGVSGQAVILKNLQTANPLTIATTSSQTVDGASPGTITNGCLILESDNANWRIVGSCGFPLTSLTSGGVIYADSTVSVASSGLLTNHAIVLGGGAGAAPTVLASLGTTTTLLHGNASGAPTFASVALADIATQSNNTILSNVSGGAAIPAANSSIPLNTPLIHVAAVCQNVTASIGLSLPASNAPTATCVTGTNTNFGVALYTATGQSMQGFVPILETLTSTTVTVNLQYYQTTTQTGAPTFTWSWARVGAAGTLDPSFTDCDSTGTTAATGGQLHVNSWTCTVTSLAKGDVLFWKFSYKTAPSGGASNMNVMDLTVMPIASKPIGGG